MKTLSNDTRQTPGAAKPPPAATYRYHVPKEFSLWAYLPVSLAFFAVSPLVIAKLVPHQEEEIKQITIEFADIEGAENEPPPLGEPDAPLEPVVEPEPEPVPAEPEPVLPEPEPVPLPVEPEPALPQPDPEPVKESPPEPAKPAPPPVKETPPAPAPKINKPAEKKPAKAPATRGVPTGVPGGRGGSKGDFIATPTIQYDRVSLARRYEGSGEVVITYNNGRIVDVAMSKSTGVSYLDTRTTTWVKRNYRVKSGVSGKAKFNIAWRLPK